MKFKYSIYNTIVAFTVFALGSCNDWLDVNPRQEMKEKVLYSTEEGFKSVLTGAYLLMGESSLYGKNTSIYLPEMLARHWTLPSGSGSTDYALGNFNYTYSGAENLIASVWERYYKTIVHLNNLLGAFDENVVHFNYHNDELIKGEALGLRGFLHFELLRYFGPVPSEAVGSEKVIPYVIEMTKDANLLVSYTWSDVVSKIEADLTRAEELLRPIDPIVTGEETTDDEWHYLYRENRFNYYAVLGAKARFYQWIGDKEKAVKYAKMVIEATNKEGEPVFTLADESSYVGVNANLIMYSEILFGVYSSKHQSIVQPLFKSKTATLTQTLENIASAYESGVQPDDLRNKPRRYWEEKTYENAVKVNHFYKYIGNDLEMNPKNVVPLMRLSELYFILIEDLPIEEATPYFVKFRISRSLTHFASFTLYFSDLQSFFYF